MTQHSAAVVGQLARDLVLTVDRIPEAGSSGTAGERLEQLGGKGANQAVALAQLGIKPFLIAMAGDDVIGDVLLDQARRDGIDVIRADEKEAGGLGEEILDGQPSLLAIAEKDGNVLIWRGGRVKIPLAGDEVVDTTGGGDSFTAGLTAALLRGASYEEAGRLATAASGSTVQHVGGRPDLRDV